MPTTSSRLGPQGRVGADRRRLDIERRAWREGKLVVAGVDEAGRGAWAGPLVAAAVSLPRESSARAQITRALNLAGTAARDSKQLSPAERERALQVMLDRSVPFAIITIPVEEIDEIGLHGANLAALRRALATLSPSPDHALVDAFRLGDLSCPHESIVRGDQLSASIALASIVAKTHRDALMRDLDAERPEYGFASHKGYGTVAHARAIASHGVTRHHRRSFAPIAKALANAVEEV